MNEDAKSAFCRRFKEARLGKKISQQKLGYAIDLEESVASARINRYEKGIHPVDINTAARIAYVLDVPRAFFYADTDDMAKLVNIYHHLNAQQQSDLLQFAEQLQAKSD